MKFKNGTKGTKKITASTVLFASAIVVLLIAISSLVNTVRAYMGAIAQYVEQGYESAEVVSQLLPNQLLPGIFESVAVYGGIALLLFGVGMINHKLSKSTELVDLDNNTVTIIDSTTKASEEDIAPLIESEDENVD